MHMTHRLTAATMIAISGALVLLGIIGPREKDIALFVFAFLGAFGAGLWMAPRFGQPGGDGVLEALFGAVFAMLVGAFLAGVIFGLFVGHGAIIITLVVTPLFVYLGLITSITATAIWALSMCATHVLMRILRGRTHPACTIPAETLHISPAAAKAP